MHGTNSHVIGQAYAFVPDYAPGPFTVATNTKDNITNITSLRHGLHAHAGRASVSSLPALQLDTAVSCAGNRLTPSPGADSVLGHTLHAQYTGVHNHNRQHALEKQRHLVGKMQLP